MKTFNPDLTALEKDATAAAVMAMLKAGKWRKARDAAKLLCRSDAAKYQPLLVAANIGLMREMRGKGLMKDAETVLAYLKTLCTNEQWEKLKSENDREAEVQPAKTQQGESPTLWLQVVEAAEVCLQGGDPGAKGWAAVDRLAIKGAPKRVLEAREASHPLQDALVAELGLVQEAWRATARGKWDTAQNALRMLPRQSIFRHWRMFLRGVKHHFQREHAAMVRCFAELPPGGALARAAQVMAGRSAVPSPGPTVPDLARAEWWLAVCGEPQRWAAGLVRANQLWMKPDYLGTWKEMIATLGKDFPCMAPNLTGELSRAIMPSGQYQSVVQQKRMQQWQTVQLHQIKVRDHDMFLGMMLRSILLVDPDEMEIHEVLTYWKEVQRIMEVKLRPNPVRSAVGLAGVAEQILNHPDSDFSGYGQPEENPLAIARKLLEESTRIAPQLKENGLALLRVLTEMKDHSARNKLLDQLSVRYPDSKEVLLWAGTQAVERKAFGKGIKSLRAACTLDPLDSNARQTLLWGLISQARDLSKKKKDTDALWGEILTHATDRSESDPFLQTRWSMLLRRGILSQDEGLIQHGQELAPSTLLALCFESTMRINYAEPPRKGWLAEWSLALKSSPQWQDLVDLLALRKWATLLPNQRGREVYDCTNHLDEVSDALFAKSLSSDSAGLLAMLTALAPLGSGRRETGMDFDLKIRLTRFYSELNRYKERPREYPYLCVAYWWLTPFGVDPMRARQALPILLEARIAFSEMENAGKSGLTVLEKLVPMVEKMVDQFKDHQIPDPKPKSKRKKAAKPKAPRKKVEPPTEEDMQRVPPAALPWLVKLANALLDDEAERVKQICAELEACGMEWELIEKFLKTPPKRLKEDDPSLKPPPASSFDQLELF